MFKPKNISKHAYMKNMLCFTCEDYLADRGLLYHLIVQFSKDAPGKFTVELTISNTPETLNKRSSGLLLVNERSIGTFRIARFWGKVDYWWRIQKDTTGDFFANVGFNELASISSKFIEDETTVWKPSSYDNPEESIFQEAMSDLNAKIVHFVLPKLMVRPDAHYP